MILIVLYLGWHAPKSKNSAFMKARQHLEIDGVFLCMNDHVSVCAYGIVWVFFACESQRELARASFTRTPLIAVHV